MNIIQTLESFIGFCEDMEIVEESDGRFGYGIPLVKMDEYHIMRDKWDDACNLFDRSPGNIRTVVRLANDAFVIGSKLLNRVAKCDQERLKLQLVAYHNKLDKWKNTARRDQILI